MSASAIETRATPGTVEFRALPEGRRIGGYALKYFQLSQNLGGYVEQCAPGLADKSIADRADVLCRFQHEDVYLLGRVRAETLLLESDGTGVTYDCPLPDTTAGRDVAALAERGDLWGSSFAFVTFADEWSETEQGFPLRTLQSIQLVDVAPVVSPAYLDTSSGLRSLAAHRSLDIADVVRAAECNGLRDLLHSHDPVVIDLGSGQRDTHPALGIRKRRLHLAG